MADDVVDVIKAQHREIDRLLDQAMAEGSDTTALLRQVSDLLTPHSEAEESFVYPTIAQKQPQEGDEVKDGAAEHHHIDEVLQALLADDPDAPGFDGRLAGLVGELRHHVEEEEQDLLPVLSQQASADERAAMGTRFAQETGWTGGTGAAVESGDGDDGGSTRAELYEQAKAQDVPGRSKMSKAELEEAVEDS